MLEEQERSEDVRFLPYIGERYEQGITGQRILLLGESHYRKEGLSDDLAITRPFTREVFCGMAEPVRGKKEGPFFKALDLLLTGRADLSAQEAADVWQRVSFANLAQSFAGSQANHRPRNVALRAGGDVLFKHILPVLKPTVVLVLGRVTWRMFRHGNPEPSVPPYLAKKVSREGGRRRYIQQRDVWSLNYQGGSALMTWVYHPSWHMDTWQDRAGALRHLIVQAGNVEG